MNQIDNIYLLQSQLVRRQDSEAEVIDIIYNYILIFLGGLFWGLNLELYSSQTSTIYYPCPQPHLQLHAILAYQNGIGLSCVIVESLRLTSAHLPHSERCESSEEFCGHTVDLHLLTLLRMGPWSNCFNFLKLCFLVNKINTSSGSANISCYLQIHLLFNK